ncbi:hypothetical protein [Mycoplasma elephantis]|uniref:hypothetical protein n=1 Tax=Mycoplasma elephantis TaxID=114882 RepID=UPI00146F9DED|nr:hypothetical protein [Mycoplasma elephantis]
MTNIFLDSNISNAKITDDGNFLIYLKKYLRTKNLWVRNIKNHIEMNITTQQMNDIDIFDIKDNKFIFYLLKNKIVNSFSLFMYNIFNNSNILISNDVISFDALENISDDCISYVKNERFLKIRKQYIFNIKTMNSTEKFEFKDKEFLFVNKDIKNQKCIYNKNLFPKYTFELAEKNYFINSINSKGKRLKILTIPSIQNFEIVGMLSKSKLLVKTYSLEKYILGKYDLKLNLQEIIYESNHDFSINKIWVENNELLKFETYDACLNLILTNYCDSKLKDFETKINQIFKSKIGDKVNSHIRIETSNDKKYCLIFETNTISKSNYYIYDIVASSLEKLSQTNVKLMNNNYIIPTNISYNGLNFIIYNPFNILHKNAQNVTHKVLIKFNDWPFCQRLNKYDLKNQIFANNDYIVVNIYLDYDIKRWLNNNLEKTHFFNTYIENIVWNIINYLQKKFYYTSLSFTFLFEGLTGYIISNVILNLEFEKNIIFDDALIGKKPHENWTYSSFDFGLKPINYLIQRDGLIKNKNNIIMTFDYSEDMNSFDDYYIVYKNIFKNIQNHYKKFKSIILTNKNKTSTICKKINKIITKI